MRAIIWALINGFFAACVWFGIAEGVEGARNVAVFLVWVVALTTLGTSSPDVVKMMAEKGPSVPRWLDVSFDIWILAVLVWFGSWVLGAAYLFHMLGTLVMWGKVKELKAVAA